MTTYEESGVNRIAKNEALALARDKIHATYYRARGMKVISKIGGYCGIVEYPSGMVQGFTADGVGGKMKLAVHMDSLDAIGTDLVAANANDLLVAGLSPDVLLDYIGVGVVEPRQVARIVASIAEACSFARIAFLGGETAEMPLIYSKDDCDLVGFAAGHAAFRKRLITGEAICPGMGVFGLRSSGVHANGFHFIFKVFGIKFSEFIEDMTKCGERFPELGMGGADLAEELLRPSEIYVHTIAHLRGKYEIAGLAHITGGGLTENIPRILPDGCAAEIHIGSWEVPPIFSIIRNRGNVSEEEMLRVFNNGIGMVAISANNLAKAGAFRIGRIIASKEKKVFFV